MESVEITTSYSDLPSDTRSALAELSAILHVGLATVENPELFIENPTVLTKRQFRRSLELIQRMLCDRGYDDRE